MSRARTWPRWLATLAALVLVSLVTSPGGVALAADRGHGPGQSRSDNRPRTGLAVSIDSMSPAYLGPGQPVDVRGRITNVDDHEWSDLQVYLVMSPSPMTSREQLDAALASPATAYSGNRITDPGFYASLGNLAPGESARYRLNVPFARLGLLSRASGVYSIGVHVIATDQFGVRNSAEATGRARSFIPMLANDAAPVELSLVWPFQAQVERTANGTYANAADLTSQVSSGGHLRRMLDMAKTAGSIPLTLLTDPALLDALSRLASGTPGPPTPAAGAATPGPTQSSGSAADGGTAQQRSAGQFLSDFTSLARTGALWAQEYGRPDLSALAQRPGTGLRSTISSATVDTLDALGLSAQRTYLPGSALDPGSLRHLDPGSVPVLSADQVRGWQPEDGPVVAVRAASKPVDVVVVDRALTDGGPVPGPTDTVLQVRQRLLSEAAILSLESSASDGPAGLVFLASPSWHLDPAWPAANFFSALSAPWLHVVPLDDQVARGPTGAVLHLAPARPAPATLPMALVTAAQRLQHRSRTLTAVIGSGPGLPAYYDQQVALSLSEYWRSDPATALWFARATLASVTEQLGRISVEGPDFVTLSSSTGRFPITITNTLDEPVQVGVHITADDPSLHFDDIGPVSLRKDESTTFTVRTSAGKLGVTGVSARLTAPGGRVFGKAASFSLRTSVVGVVVWIALGAAAALVLLAIVRRVLRRDRGGDTRRGAARGRPIRTAP